MKIISEDFPELVKDTCPQIQISQLISSKINKRKDNLRHIFMEMQNSKIERVSKTAIKKALFSKES